MREVPARTKRVVVTDTSVLVTLPADESDGAAVIENEGRVGTVFVSSMTRPSPTTLATNPVPDALIMAARPAAISASGTVSRTWLP